MRRTRPPLSNQAPDFGDVALGAVDRLLGFGRLRPVDLLLGGEGKHAWARCHLLAHERGRLLRRLLEELA